MSPSSRGLKSPLLLFASVALFSGCRFELPDRPPDRTCDSSIAESVQVWGPIYCEEVAYSLDLGLSFLAEEIGEEAARTALRVPFFVVPYWCLKGAPDEDCRSGAHSAYYGIELNALLVATYHEGRHSHFQITEQDGDHDHRTWTPEIVARDIEFEQLMLAYFRERYPEGRKPPP